MKTSEHRREIVRRLRKKNKHVDKKKESYDMLLDIHPAWATALNKH